MRPTRCRPIQCRTMTVVMTINAHQGIGFKGGWPYCANGTEPATCVFDETAKVIIFQTLLEGVSVGRASANLKTLPPWPLMVINGRRRRRSGGFATRSASSTRHFG